MTEHFRRLVEIDIAADELNINRAIRMLEVVRSDRLDEVCFVSCKADVARSCEAILIDITVPLGQRALVNDIRLVESLAIVFHAGGMPAVYPLRQDFPFHLPHVNKTIANYPRSLCVSDRPLEDQNRDYTAVSFLGDVRWWLEKSAYGELHGEEQPLDPMFFGSMIQIIAPREIEDATYVVGAPSSSQPNSPIVLQAVLPGEIELSRPFVNFVSIETPPVPHGQVNWVPSNLQQLIEVYRDLDVNIYDSLCNELIKINESEDTKSLIDSPLIVMLTTTIVSEDRSLRQRKVYMSNASAGEIGAALGVLEKGPEGWAQILKLGTQQKVPLSQVELGDETSLAQIELFSADINTTLDRDSASIYSGYKEGVTEKIALVGAGAVGSHFSIAAARGGVGSWHIVDDDFLLPHNLARHALAPNYLGEAKAVSVASMIKTLLNDADAAYSYVSRIESNQIPAEAARAFDDAVEVVDASASVPVARQLAFDSNIACSVTSIFLNPVGDDAVMLSEDIGRNTTIDCVEIYYYWMICTDTTLEGHLHEPGSPVPMGGCRTPSARIPETQVASLSALLAGRWISERQPHTAQVSIWRGDSNFGSVRFLSKQVPEFKVVVIGDWTVKISQEVLNRIREIKSNLSPRETGGIVVGAWDKDRKVVYVVGVYDAPPNSKHSNTSFVRGSVGVYETISDLQLATLRNLSYIGEWHSHPPGSDSRPSSDDNILLRWIGDALEPAEAPALMIITADEGERVLLQSEEGIHDAVIPVGIQTEKC